jgi:hypothetical protein
MQKRPFLCFILTIYDIFRWMLMTVLLLAAVGAAEKGIVPGGGFSKLNMIPYLIYAAAPAIFPLMMFFMWQDSDVYRPFSGLYIAGKIIGIVAVVVWCFFNWSFSGSVLLIRFGTGREILFRFIIPLLSLLDLLSVLGIFTIQRKK